MANKAKEFCECTRPIDRGARDGSGLQCRRCYELNRFALSMHERTRRWLDEQEWAHHLRQNQLNRWLRRQHKGA